MLDVAIGSDGLGPSIDEGPRLAYLAMFPDRVVRWHGEMELWEVRYENDTRQSLLFEWEVSPDMENLEVDRLRHFFNRGHPDVWRAFKPFDYRHVADRRRDWWEGQHLSLTERLKRNKEHNDRLVKGTLDHIAYERAAAMGEIRGWLGPLADAWDIADGLSDSRHADNSERIHQVAVATSL